MENEKDKTIFKVPNSLIGPRPGTKKVVKCVDTKIVIPESDSPATNTNEIKQEKTEHSIKPIKKTSQVPIPYEEPTWGGKPGDMYFLEVCLTKQ